MSTKIHNGFRLENADMGEMYKLVERFRNKMAGAAQEKAARYLAAFSCHRIDELILGMMEPSDSNKRQAIISGAWQSWSDRVRQIARTQERDPAVDTQLDLLFLPSPYGVLGIVYTDTPEWTNEWLWMEGVQSFGYWNNSDPEEGVSDKDWKLRKKAWEAALGSDIPAMRGFTISVTDPNGPSYLGTAEILKHAVPASERIQGILKHLGMRVWLEKNHDRLVTEGMILENGNFAQTSDYIRSTRMWEAEQKEPAWQVWFKEGGQKLSQLIPEIDESLLLASAGSFVREQTYIQSLGLEPSSVQEETPEAPELF